MPDTTNIFTNKPINVDIVDHSRIDWNMLTLIIATLSLIAAVLLPFAQKKYEEYKAKYSFKLYVKKQFAYLFNQVIGDKLDYTEPSIKDTPIRHKLSLADFSSKLISDFTEHQNTIQPRLIFHYVQNLQKFCHQLYQIRHNISTINLEKLKDNALANGEKLSKNELNKTYGLILILEAFNSISLFHDRFGDLYSMKRTIKDNIWVGLQLDKDFLEKQHILVEDMKKISNNESSLHQLTDASKVLYSKLNEYFDNPDYDRA